MLTLDSVQGMNWKNGLESVALSRAYYATLHAAKAALYVHDVATATHTAVRRMFGLHLMQRRVSKPALFWIASKPISW